MALTKAQEAVYYAAIKADERFSHELRRVYGKKSGEMRYRPNLWTDRGIKAAALHAKRAKERWLKVMRSFREKNPMRVHNPSWHQKKAGPIKLAPGWYIEDDTNNFRSVMGPFDSKKEADERIALFKKHGTYTGQIVYEVRAKNPDNKKVHTAKWDRCVKEVRKRGTAADPYAVCTAAMGELAVRKPHRRTANPLPKVTAVRRIFYAVTATKGREKLYLKRSGKLTRSASNAARFHSVNDAIAHAKAHLKRYPASRSYKFDVGLAY